MSFKQLYISESLKMNRYEKYIDQVLKELKKSLLETMPYLKEIKSVEDIKKNQFKIRLDFQKFTKARNTITNDNDFEKYGHKFITISVPKYLEKEDVEVNFYFCLDDRKLFGALASTKKPEIMIMFDYEDLIRFVLGNREVVNKKEDIIVHELAHIIDPSRDKTKKMLQKTIAANIKTNDGDFEPYYKLPWEKVAFHTQNVRRVIHDIVKDKEFHKIADSGSVQAVSKYLYDKIKDLKQYLDTKEEIRDRNKIYKELYKEVLDIVDKYKASIEGK